MRVSAKRWWHYSFPPVVSRPNNRAEAVVRPLFSYLRENGRWSGTFEELRVLAFEATDPSYRRLVPRTAEETAGVLWANRSKLLEFGFGYHPTDFRHAEALKIYKMTPENATLVKRNRYEWLKAMGLD